MIAQLSIGTRRINDDSRIEHEEPMSKTMAIAAHDRKQLFDRHFFTVTNKAMSYQT
jgi:hypothetical protein